MSSIPRSFWYPNWTKVELSLPEDYGTRWKHIISPLNHTEEQEPLLIKKALDAATEFATFNHHVMAFLCPPQHVLQHEILEVDETGTLIKVHDCFELKLWKAVTAKVSPDILTAVQELAFAKQENDQAAKEAYYRRKY